MARGFALPSSGRWPFTSAPVRAPPRSAALRPRLVPAQVPERPHLDAAQARRRYSLGHLDGLVEVPCLDQVEPAELLLGLGERAVGRRKPAAPHPHGLGRVNRLERLREDRVTALLQLLVDRDVLVRERLELARGHGLELLFLAIDQAQVLHPPLPLLDRL